MQNFEILLILDNEPISGAHFSSFQYILHLMAEFNEKYENTNFSTVNACGLAIFVKFLT
jgi:hypothetical protein